MRKHHALLVGLLIAVASAAYAETFSSTSPTDITLAHLADVPSACSTVPSQDTLNGNTGTCTCYVQANSTRPTITQAMIVTTDSSGNFSGTWAKPSSTANPYVNAQPINVTGANPYLCNPMTTTASTVSGKCWMVQTATLASVAINLLGQIITPFAAFHPFRSASTLGTPHNEP